jgi:superfamily I DNA and/or RNA helicase
MHDHAVQVQYRMHPGLAAFPNARFYGGQLADGVAERDRRPPPGLPWPAAAPFIFVDVSNGQEVSGWLGSG